MQIKDGTPISEGYYFGTHRKYGWRTMMEFARDGKGHMRLHVPRMSRSFGVEEFQDLDPVEDPHPLPCQKKLKEGR